MKKISKRKFVDLIWKEADRQLYFLKLIDNCEVSKREYDLLFLDVEKLIGGSFVELLAEIVGDTRGLIEWWFNCWQTCRGDIDKFDVTDTVIEKGDGSLEEMGGVGREYNITDPRDLYERIMLNDEIKKVVL